MQPLRLARSASGIVHDFPNKIEAFDIAGLVIFAQPIQILLCIFKNAYLVNHKISFQRMENRIPVPHHAGNALLIGH